MFASELSLELLSGFDLELSTSRGYMPFGLVAGRCVDVLICRRRLVMFCHRNISAIADNRLPLSYKRKYTLRKFASFQTHSIPLFLLAQQSLSLLIPEANEIWFCEASIYDVSEFALCWHCWCAAIALDMDTGSIR